MVMLKGVPPIISPELMKTLMEMGHGDEIVFADGNFPAASNAKRLIRYDGHNIIDILSAVMPFFPLDRSAARSAAVMAPDAGEPAPAVWDSYHSVIKQYEPAFQGFEQVERFAFYERARQAFSIIATSDTAPRGNLIIKKGVVRP
jgi:L-fucose mutarotase